MKKEVSIHLKVGAALLLLFLALSILWIFVLGPQGVVGKAYAFFYTGEPVKISSAPSYETKPDLDATKAPSLKAYVCRDLHPRSNKDFYVDGNSLCGPCSDGNPGTVTQPWCTFERAFKRSLSPHLEGSGKLYIREGTYRFDSMGPFGSELSWYLNLSGTANNPTVISGYPGERPKIYFSDRIQSWERYTERLEENIWVINWKSYLQANHNGQYLYTYKEGTRAPQLVAIDENPIVLFQEINSLKNGWTFHTPEDSWADSRFPGGTTSVGTDQSDMNQGTTPTFYYESDRNDPDFGKLFIWFPDETNPNNRKVEVSVSPRMPFAFSDRPMDYIHLKDLTFRFAGAQFGAVGLSGSYNRFENLDSSYNGFSGLDGACKNCVVKNSVFRFNGNTGVAVQGENTLIEGNIVEGNNVRKYSRGWHAGGVKFVKNEGQWTTKNMVFRNNLVKNNFGWGVWFDFALMENAIIEGNVIVNNSFDGIRIEVSGGTTEKPAIIRNNILINNAKRTFEEQLYFYGGIVLSLSHDVLIENNLMYDSPAGVTGIVYTTPEYPLRQNTMRNNIFINVSFPLTIPRPENGLAEDNTADNNIFMNPGPSFYWDNLIQSYPTMLGHIALWEKLDKSIIFCYGSCFGWDVNGKNFTQWQELGFDTNSVMLEPRGINIFDYNINLNKAPGTPGAYNTRLIISKIRADLENR